MLLKISYKKAVNYTGNLFLSMFFFAVATGCNSAPTKSSAPIADNNKLIVNVLDDVNVDTKVVNDLKDLYKAFDIEHILTDQKDLINLYAKNEAGEELDSLINKYLTLCDSLKQISFSNDTLKLAVTAYLNATVQHYKIISVSGSSSKAFKKDVDTYSKANDKYLTYLTSTYATSRFFKMTEDEYWKLNDKKNYIKAADYARYQKLKPTNLKSAIALLQKIITQTANFQEAIIYKIELADQYVKHADSLGASAEETALKQYKALLNERRYSIYLFETWLKWRTLDQYYNNGLSTTSEIPNALYNKVRQQVASLILQYVAAHPTDKMAINSFLLMASHDVIRRFGSYQYGNQNTIEYHQLFDQ